MQELLKKLKRQIEIIGLALDGGAECTPVDLAVRFGCEELTIKRDLGDLRSNGIDIHSRKGIGVRISRRIEGPRLVSLLHQYFSICSSDQSADRATRLMVRRQREEALKIVVLLQLAIEARRIVTIDYVKESAAVERGRELQPLMIFESDGDWRLLAINEGRIKQYLLNKMRNLHRTGRTFRRIPQEEIDAMFQFSFRSWIGTERHTIRIRLSRIWAGRIKPRQIMESQLITEEEDGSVIFEATVNSLAEVAGWVVSRGEGVTVLDPPALRDLVIGTAEGALRNYPDHGPG